MYRLSVYENKLSFKYCIGRETYRYKWIAQLLGFLMSMEINSRYEITGVYATTEIEKI